MSARFDRWIRSAVEHRVVVLLATAMLVVLGAWLARDARLDALPDFSPPIVLLQAEAPGLGSTAVEELVATPLEQSLLGIAGATTVRSTSTPGLAVIQVTFADDQDLFRARQLVAERLTEATQRLPADFPAPRMAPIAAPVGALLKFVYTAASEDPTAIDELWRFAEWQVRPRLQAIAGVSRITVHGGAATRIEVRPDPVRMLAHGVDLPQLNHVLRGAQGTTSLGFQTQGPQQQPVRVDGRWRVEDLPRIGSIVIGNREGTPIRVMDVADVALGNALPLGAALFDERSGIYVQIDKLPWADTLRVTEQIEVALQQLDPLRPANTVRQPPSFRQADFIRTSLFGVGRAMAIGSLLVVAMLVVFLRSPRLSMISLIALPTSLIVAGTVLLAFDVTINAMILGGLAIAVGEVVDDAIVDVENVWRRLRENTALGAPRHALEVIANASTEVRGAVVYATLLVVVVLVPILLLEGITGRIFAPLAVAYGLAIAASLLVALTVTPALCAMWLPQIAGERHHEPAVARWLRGSYDRLLERVSRCPGRTTLVATLPTLAAIGAMPWLGGGYLPEFREGVLIAEVAVWPGASLAETTRTASLLSSALRGHAGIEHVAVRIGRASLDEDAAPVHRMEVDLVLAADARDPEEVVALVVEKLADFPGLRCGVEGFLGERINELLSGQRAPIAVQFLGQDLDRLRQAAKSLIAGMNEIRGVDSVRCNGLIDVPTVDLAIDATKLAIHGMQRTSIVEAVAAWRHGLPVAKAIGPGGSAVPIVIASDPRLTHAYAWTEAPVTTPTGICMPVSNWVDLVEQAEPPEIHHEGGRRVVTVTARADSADQAQCGDRITDLAHRSAPPGVEWALAGQIAERNQAQMRLVFVSALVLIAVAGFLWLAFGSFIDTCVVLVGIPVGMAGGVLAALALPEGLSVAGMIGFIALSGIVSRNGIMLIGHKNRLLAEGGANRQQLILQSARERLIPIVMTAATTFFGLLPLAASIEAAGSELEAPMAFIVCGGLVSSTIVNLLAVPAFYLWLDRRRALRLGNP